MTLRRRLTTSWDKVLVVEPDPERARKICSCLAGTDLESEIAASFEDARSRVQAARHVAVILGSQLPADQLYELLAADPRILFVVVPDGAPAPIIPELENQFVSASVDLDVPDELIAAVRRAKRLRRVRASRAPLASRILMIEDDDTDAKLVMRQLRALPGVQITRAEDLRSAIAILQTTKFDFVVSDLSLPDARGIDTVLRVRRYAPDTPLVVLSGNEDAFVSLEAVQAGAQDFILKSTLTSPVLLRALHHAVERRAREDLMRRAANQDALTGLGNRVWFHERLAECLARARRPSAQLALLYVDLDGFKTVNDELGHLAGDTVLVEVGRRLRTALGETDVIARLGGDEFAVVVDAPSSTDNVTAIVERVVTTIAEPYGEQAPLRAIRASVGVALSDGTDDPQRLVNEADAAMYAAKGCGGGRYVLAPRSDKRVDTSRRYDREFEVHYQVQIDRTGEPCAAEALLRRRVGNELLLPDRFLPDLENSNEIGPVGAWVIHQACRQLATWRDGGTSLTRIAVNVSPRQLDDSLVESVRDAIAEFAIEPDKLELEITETAVMRRAKVAARTLDSLKALGVRIAMDDFGVGHSSLANLHHLPFDVLKIDRSFVADVANPRARAMMRAMFALGRELALEIVAEGVETQEQYRFVHGEGSDRFQGFLFGRAISADVLEAKLAAITRRTVQMPIAV